MSIKILMVFLLFHSWVFCSEDTTTDVSVQSKSSSRYPIWITPSSVDYIYGVALMPFSSGAFFHKPQTVNGFGLHFIGAGLLAPAFISQFPSDQDRKKDSLQTHQGCSANSELCSGLKSELNVNGLFLSLTGTGVTEINGITMSAFCGYAKKVNGVSLNPLLNLTYELNGLGIGIINDSHKVIGVQFGIYNSARILNGIQIGIINRSRERILPIFNWGNEK